MAVCIYCSTQVELKDGVWIDFTDGDCCWGDESGNNENELHKVEA